MKSRFLTSLQHQTTSERHGRWRACSQERPFSRGVGVSEDEHDSPLAYSSKYWKVTLGSSFQPTYHFFSNPDNDSARRNWGQTWSRASTQSNISAKAFVGRLTEEELHHSCRMEFVLVLSKNNYLWLIMPSKLLDFLFQPVLVLWVSS